MSKNPSIQEGGQPKAINGAAKLQTFLVEGGTQLWIPEDEISNYLGNLDITENGTYRAESYGVPGWKTINVRVEGDYVTGEDPESGQEVIVEPDPETGELVETVLPTSIVITTPPTKTQYQGGEEIDITGIVVTAYDKLGNVWTNEDYPTGVIPVSELVISPTTATARIENISVNWKRPKDLRRLMAAFEITVTDLYSVTFMNGETVLQVADNVPYGGTAFYTGETPEKEGYEFTGWLPEPTNVTADLVCYAQFTKEYSWTADNAYLAFNADTVLADNDGSRTPFVKKNDGQCLVWNGVNVGGQEWGGDWYFTICISTKHEAAEESSSVTYGGMGWRNDKEYLGLTWFLYANLGNPVWGGGSTIESSYPVRDYGGDYVLAINGYGISDEYFVEFMQRAGVRLKSGPATPTLTLSPSSLSLSAASPVGEVTVTTNSDGAITVSSSDANIATAAIAGNTVRVNAGSAAGTATITVNVAATDAYEAASGTISVVNSGDSSHESGNF